MKKDYYKILEISSTDSQDKIKESYRRLARQYHPDISSDPNADELFKDITEAYEVLSDPVARNDYDERRVLLEFDSRIENGFENFDKNIFGKLPKKPKKGPILVGKIILSKDEIVTTGKAIINLTVEENCPTCQGKGVTYENDNEYVCVNCQGVGRFEIDKTITAYIPDLNKTKQNIIIPRVGNAGYIGGERGDVKLKVILQ